RPGAPGTARRGDRTGGDPDQVRGLYSKTAHAGRTDAQTGKPPSPGRYSIRGDSWPAPRSDRKAPKGSSAQHRPGLPHLGSQPGAYFGAFDLSGEQKTGRITVSCETFCRGGTNSRWTG